MYACMYVSVHLGAHLCVCLYVYVCCVCMYTYWGVGTYAEHSDSSSARNACMCLSE